MAEPNVQIHITTTANTQGAQAATTATRGAAAAATAAAGATAAQTAATTAATTAAAANTAATQAQTQATQGQGNAAAAAATATQGQATASTAAANAAQAQAAASNNAAAGAARQAAGAGQAAAASTAAAGASNAAAAAANSQAAASTAAANAANNQAGAANNAANAAQNAATGTVQWAGFLLDASRALQDWDAAGMQGIVNNIELLARRLGAGPGLAGAATVAAVALPVVIDLMGKLSGKTPAQPLLGELTFSEEQEARMRLLLRHLDDQTLAIQRRNEALREGLAAQEDAWAREQRMREERRKWEDEDFVSTGDPVQDILLKRDRAMKRSWEDQNARSGQRVERLKTEETAQAAREQDAKKADDDYQAQKGLVEGLAKRDALTAKFTQLQKEIGDTSRSLTGEIADPLKDRDGFMRDMGRIVRGEGGGARDVAGNLMMMNPLTFGLGALIKSQPEDLAKAEERARQAKSLLAMEEEYQRVWQQMQALPVLPGAAERDADPAKAREQERKLYEAEQKRLAELEQRRLQLAEEAAKGKRQVERTRAVTVEEETFDQEKGQRERAQIEKQADRDLTAAVATPPSSAEVGLEGAAVRAELTSLMNGAKDPAFRQQLSELRALLTDADGATQQDVAQIKAYLESVKTSNADANATIANALRDLADMSNLLKQQVAAQAAQIREMKAAAQAQGNNSF